MAAKAVKKGLSFEEGLGRLEALAQDMERSELPLEQLVQKYEEAMKLSSELMKKLEAAKARMLEIREGRDGKPVAEESCVTEQPSFLEDTEGGV